MVIKDIKIPKPEFYASVGVALYSDIQIMMKRRYQLDNFYVVTLLWGAVDFKIQICRNCMGTVQILLINRNLGLQLRYFVTLQTWISAFEQLKPIGK